MTGVPDSAEAVIVPGVLKKANCRRKRKAATCFVWQPISMYNYGLRYEMARSEVLRYGRFNSVRAACVATRVYSDGHFGSGLMYLADIQKNQNIDLYLDAYHYRAMFSREIADRVSEFTLQKNFLTSSSRTREDCSSGVECSAAR